MSFFREEVGRGDFTFGSILYVFNQLRKVQSKGFFVRGRGGDFSGKIVISRL